MAYSRGSTNKLEMTHFSLYIVNIDRTLKWSIEHPHDVMAQDMCVRMIVYDWFSEFILFNVMSIYIEFILLEMHLMVCFLKFEYLLFNINYLMNIYFSTYIWYHWRNGYL